MNFQVTKNLPLEFKNQNRRRAVMRKILSGNHARKSVISFKEMSALVTLGRGVAKGEQLRTGGS